MQTSVYTGRNTDRWPSPNLWHNCPWTELRDHGKGIAVMEHFLGGPASSAGGPWLTDETDDKFTFAAVSQVGGGIRLGITGDDNEEGWCLAGGGVHYPFMISDAAATARRLWFESRFRVSAVTDNVCGIVLGLVDANLVAGDDTLQTANDAALEDLGFIGVQTLQADGDALNVFYRKNGQTGVTLISGIQALVANTWYKWGFMYDPNSLSIAERIKFYMDGVENATKVTSTQIATATFPDAVPMNFVAGAKVGSNAALNFDVDWYRAAQEF